MNKTEIISKVTTILNEYFALPNVDYAEGTKISGLDYDIDIVDLMVLSIELETEFGVEITDEETDSFITFGDIIKCIESKIGVDNASVSKL